MNQSIKQSIEHASKVIGKTWPLYTFVASNPLSGYEKSSFIDAVSAAQKHFNANAFPSANLYNQAWNNGIINKDILVAALLKNGFTETPEYYLKKFEEQKSFVTLNKSQSLDRIMAKWLSAFMDEGLAEWDMPYKSEGFYKAWRLLASYDSDLGSVSLKDIPKTSEEALAQVLEGFSEADYEAIFTEHLAALPGWTGYINHRTASNSDWQEEFPISLADYLAVRLWISKKLSIPFLTASDKENSNSEILNLKYIWLKAWEQSWQNQLVKTLDESSIETNSIQTDVPDAQMVFCIDTRSELIRRHVESKGHYETFGYAGFFGIAMDYQSLEDGITRKSCPPIVNSAYQVTEKAQSNKAVSLSAYAKKNEVLKFSDYFLTRMKNMLPSAFGYVEGAGFFYGLSLLGKTLFSKSIYKLNRKSESKVESICEPNISKSCSHDEVSLDISLEEKVGIVKSGFDLMGWKQFARLVLFVGHGSHSANNPFSSSLDCGACAASPGRHNARMLAKLANLKEVRQALKEVHGILIPDSTVFIGAEHNTTTDAIVLFDSEVPDSHKSDIEELKANLFKAQETATQDRFGLSSNSVTLAKGKAGNWSETRPEWGLAKNAGFIVGPRSLTKNTNLDSGCFLHSYDWKLDTTGKALEGIMQGPMVVTQWINNHYYFSTVDNNIYGGGSKITHNITGKFGVVQGNGGDLKMGLPLQSLYQTDDLMYHKPLRLSVVIQAPTSRVLDILLRNDNLKSLLDNEWIYLMIMDPEQNNKIVKYDKSLKLEDVSNDYELVVS